LTEGIKKFDMSGFATQMGEHAKCMQTISSTLVDLKDAMTELNHAVTSQKRALDDHRAILKHMKKEKAFTINQFLDFAQKLNTVPMPFGIRGQMGIESGSFPGAVETGQHAHPGLISSKASSTTYPTHMSGPRTNAREATRSSDQDEEEEDEDYEQSASEGSGEEASPIPPPPKSSRIPRKSDASDNKKASSNNKKRPKDRR
jgi:hypothetical protein